MLRIIALLRETWWLWIFFYGSCIALMVYVDGFMLVTLPLITAILVYFAFVRFDEDGKPRYPDHR